MRTPEATVGGRSSNGHGVAVDGHAAPRAAAPRAALPGPLGCAQVELHEVRVGAAGEHVEAALHAASRRARRRCARTCRWYSRNASVIAIRKHVAFAAIVCIERPALHAGEDGAVDRLRVLLAAEDEAGARAGERLVRRRGDEVAVRHRVRVQPGGDEPGEVRHVAHQQRPDLVGDLAELVGLDGARIGGAAADDQLRPLLLRAARAPRRSRPSSSRARRRSAAIV